MNVLGTRRVRRDCEWIKVSCRHHRRQACKKNLACKIWKQKCRPAETDPRLTGGERSDINVLYIPISYEWYLAHTDCKCITDELIFVSVRLILASLP